jgi:hypothetical protein
MKLKGLPKKVTQEFLNQNKEYSLCEICKGIGYATFYINICLRCKGYCGGCIFLDRKGKVRLTSVDECSYCSGTGYRTWIDRIKFPYPINSEEWEIRPVPTWMGENENTMAME